jgi:hypothetical protein
MTMAAIAARASTAAIRLSPRTTIWSFLLGILIGLGWPGSLAATQQFSADLIVAVTVGGDATAPRSGKIYVLNGKVRVEAPDLPGGFFLLDGTDHTAYFVKPAQRVFMDAKQSTWLTQILVPLDPGDPCRQWQAMAEIAGAADRGGQWRCDRVGRDSVDGRNMIKYRAISPEGVASDCWIDPQLGFVVSVHRDDGAAMDLENIQDELAPAAFFEIPAYFRRFDPHQLIDRIKQSDVWVELPR